MAGSHLQRTTTIGLPCPNNNNNNKIIIITRLCSAWSPVCGAIYDHGCRPGHPVADHCSGRSCPPVCDWSASRGGQPIMPCFLPWFVAGIHGFFCLTKTRPLNSDMAAPYSLIVSLIHAVALVPPMFGGHFVVYGVARAAEAGLCAMAPSVFVPVFALTSFEWRYHRIYDGDGTRSGRRKWIGGGVFKTAPDLACFAFPTHRTWHVALFFLLDQAVCCYCHFLTPTVEFSAAKLMRHVAWGALNTKVASIVHCGAMGSVWPVSER